MIHADENVWLTVVAELRRGWRLTAAVEAGTLGSSDEEHLRYAIDRGPLVRILDRVGTTRQVDRAYLTLRHDETCLIVEYDLDVYPPGVEDAYLTIRWYRNDDFGVHYHESWERSSWNCRWDRHPNQHNTDDHFHPPPDAPTQGDDASYPGGLHDVLRFVESEVNARIRSLWGADS